MISTEELNSVKNLRKTNLFYEEKEYFQYIFLNAISKFSDKFVFKGGTALRICFGLERASEDLDFSTSLKISEIKEIVRKCLKDFEYLNIKYEIYSEKEFEGNLRFEIRFKGPLYQGSSKSTNTLKIDFNKVPVKNKIVKVVQKIFSDVSLFSIVVLDEKEILAEKIRALINRKESRDLYDIWMLFNKNIIIEKSFLIKKLKEENLKILDLKTIQFPSRERYETELKNLILNLPPYEQVKKEVELNIKKLHDKKNL